MRKTVFASLVAAALLAAACEGGSGTTAIISGNNGNASVRAANTTAGAPTIDVLANSTALFDSVPAGTTTAFIPVPEGDVAFSVRTTGSLTSLTNTTATLVAGTNYTLVVQGSVPNMSAHVVADTTIP